MASSSMSTSAAYDQLAMKGTQGEVPEDMYYGTSVATSSPSVRTGFIRKVYGLLAAQLALTTFTCALFMYVPVLRAGIIAAGGVVQLITIVASICLIIALTNAKDSYPTNLYLLFAFTMVESVLVGFICAKYQQNGLGVLVLEALAITLAIFAILTVYCFVSGKDFSFMGGALFVALFVLIAGSIVNLFLGITGHRSPFLSMAIACGGAVLFSLYILYDSKYLPFCMCSVSSF